MEIVVTDYEEIETKKPESVVSDEIIEVEVEELPPTQPEFRFNPIVDIFSSDIFTNSMFRF